MVLPRYLRDGPGEVHLLEDVVARLGVSLDQLELDAGELAGLAQDLSRDLDLAYIVHQPGYAQSLALLRAQPHPRAELRSQPRDALLVLDGVGILLADDLPHSPDNVGEGLTEPRVSFRYLALGLLSNLRLPASFAEQPGVVEGDGGGGGELIEQIQLLFREGIRLDPASKCYGNRSEQTISAMQRYSYHGGDVPVLDKVHPLRIIAVVVDDYPPVGPHNLSLEALVQRNAHSDQRFVQPDAVHVASILAVVLKDADQAVGCADERRGLHEYLFYQSVGVELLHEGHRHLVQQGHTSLRQLPFRDIHQEGLVEVRVVTLVVVEGRPVLHPVRPTLPVDDPVVHHERISPVPDGLAKGRRHPLSVRLEDDPVERGLFHDDLLHRVPVTAYAVRHEVDWTALQQLPPEYDHRAVRNNLV